MRNPGAERMAAIVDLYYDYVGRRPDAGGLSHFFGSAHSIDEMRELFRNSAETLEVAGAVESVRDQIARFGAKTNILMFGAYGNGNLGDRVMAPMLADYIETNFDAKVFVYSELATAVYHLRDDGRRLSKSQRPLNPLVMSLFDGLVLGGGGFLATYHEPAWEPSWSYEIPIPYGILGNGVENPLPEPLRPLVSRAAFATGRDALSVEALSAFNGGSFLCPDPILSLGPLSEGPRMQGRGTVFILRGPRRALHERVRAQAEPDDLILSLEPVVDHPLAELFPSMRFATSWDQLRDILQGFDTVVSERYHGAIAGLLAGKRVYGLEQEGHNSSKVISLFDTLSLSSYHVSANDDFPSWDGNYPFPQVRTKLLEMRARFQGAATKAVASVIYGSLGSPAHIRNPK